MKDQAQEGWQTGRIHSLERVLFFVMEAKPYGLLRYFKEHDYLVSCPYRGIYYIEGKVLFPTQIVVTRGMNQTEHIWLSSLSDQLDKQNLLELLEEIGRLHGKADKEFARSVLEVGLGANKKMVKDLIGDEKMSEELLEMLKPIIEPKIVFDIFKGLYRDKEHIIKYL